MLKLAITEGCQSRKDQIKMQVPGTINKHSPEHQIHVCRFLLVCYADPIFTMYGTLFYGLKADIRSEM